MEEPGAWKIPAFALAGAVAAGAAYAFVSQGILSLTGLDATKVIVYMMVIGSGVVCLLAIGLLGSETHERSVSGPPVATSPPAAARRPGAVQRR
jgi:hypothetical protein